MNSRNFRHFGRRIPSVLCALCLLVAVGALGGICARAETTVRDMPLRAGKAWRKNLDQLEQYRRGGQAPPPLRIDVFTTVSAPGAVFRANPQPADVFSGSGPDWRSIIRHASRRHGLDEALLTAVLRVESNFNPRAVSSKGALGAMQIMPETGRELGLTDFYDPLANTDAGARYLAAMLRAFNRLDLSLAAYNAGPEAVRRHGGKIPPYEETRNYVTRVLNLYNKITAGNKFQP